MFSTLALQSNPFLSRRLRPCFVVTASLLLPLCAQAQPLDREIVPTRGPFGQFDPPAITPAELLLQLESPTLVTYSGTNVPVKDAVQALLSAAKISPTNFQLPNNDELGTVSVSWKELPFWTAASQLEELADGKWSGDYQGGLMFRKNYRPAGKNQGIEPGLDGLLGAQTPFVALYGNTVTRNGVRKLFIGENQGPVEVSPDQLTLGTNAYFDPKLNVRSVNFRNLRFQAKPNGPIVQPNNNNFYSMTSSGRGNAQVSKQSINIPAELANEKILSRISGTLQCVITTNSETWKIADLAAADKTPRAAGGGQYVIDSFEVKNDQVTLKITGTIPPEQRQVMLNVPFNTLKIRDSQGRELRRGGSSMNGGNERIRSEISFSTRTVDNQPATGPFSMEWTIPTQMRSYEVPFEFRDVPLP